MGISVAVREPSPASSVDELLQETDYRQAIETYEKDEIYRLRYQCYFEEDAIEENEGRRFSDYYDEMDNCWNFGVHIHGQLVGAIRFHVLSKAHRRGPALDVFPDIVSPMLENGFTIVDPTRFVVSRAASRRHAQLPHMTMRLACMASEYFEAEVCLATVRVEHAPFYKRIFGFETICEPRPYPTLIKPITLMVGDMAKIRDRVARRHPMFMSTYTERRMLFERAGFVPPSIARREAELDERTQPRLAG